MATRFQARLEPLQLLNDLLPAMCESLSLARAQIALDQIRSVLQANESQRLLLITAGDFVRSDLPLAAVLSIQAPVEGDGKSLGDAATIVHAGSLRPLQQHEKRELAELLSEQLDQRLRDRGVEFVQWSTDDTATPSGNSLSTWCNGLGFEPLATLNYLSGAIERRTSFDDSRADSSAPSPTSKSFQLARLDWNRDDEPAAFAEFVDQTYCETQDCPMLAHYRTPLQTLQGYQTSGAFAPDWWFRLLDREDGQPLGCLVLGHHRGDEQKEHGGDVAEIVYMGLIESARGRGLGSEMVRIAKELAHCAGCSRIILAVDQSNHPAASIYRREGLQFVLSETVWVKSLASKCGGSSE